MSRERARAVLTRLTKRTSGTLAGGEGVSKTYDWFSSVRGNVVANKVKADSLFRVSHLVLESRGELGDRMDAVALLEASAALDHSNVSANLFLVTP